MYEYIWGNNPIRAEYRGQPVHLLARGAKNSALVEFLDGHRMITSQYAIEEKEKNMIIKITAIRNSKLGKHDAKEVVGEKTDGQEWTKKFFANNDDLQDELREFGIGDMVNVKLEKDGKFWNIKGFSEVTQEDLADEAERKEKFGGNKTYAPSSPSAKSSGYSKGGWNGRTGAAYDRSAAIYLAFDIMKSTKSAAELKKIILLDIIELAEEINKYIHEGTNASTEFLNAGDPLAPPKK
jgi:hypothetical protein